jgi:hypothetical protein
VHEQLGEALSRSVLVGCTHRETEPDEAPLPGTVPEFFDKGTVPLRLESFDSLYTGRGLSTDRTVELLIETAERALYEKPYRR